MKRRPLNCVSYCSDALPNGGADGAFIYRPPLFSLTPPLPHVRAREHDSVCNYTVSRKCNKFGIIFYTYTYRLLSTVLFFSSSVHGHNNCAQKCSYAAAYDLILLLRLSFNAAAGGVEGWTLFVYLLFCRSVLQSLATTPLSVNLSPSDAVASASDIHPTASWVRLVNIIDIW